ncbi:rRNA maturation RNase YbeY [Dielma fastidiosa]|uniref:Endoribonuclease YbeY n=1 Tax=Dielma fastidiosa TaxID=1034346 RepID=A0A318KFF4_9FIRM|nr:rRNA maturation RNase YbeY [Dielma fastidiosa]PXX76874.1 putative rRNA maturation factor [Dielma fastidiosa]
MEINMINQTEESEWESYAEDFQKISGKTSKVLRTAYESSCSVVFVTPDAIQEINRDYRSIDKPTDVISFALKDSEEDYMISEEIDEELGDIFINVEAVRNQAQEYGHSIRREVCFLFTHGLLHLLGYDHMQSEDEKIMFALQDVILNDLVPKTAD